ncbi:FUSC family protein [Paenibacillus sp. FA6]|uniref:FUSC family protein n=1 Tax=Paenibacillus sp. FA6 TaxID=3413029 RepID=UPI003F65CFEF
MHKIAIKQAFKMNKNPLPWTKAISAGICSGVPPLIGLLLGNFQYGLLAGIGGLTYLYVFNIPYALRAKKLLFALLGMSLSVGLGTLLAPFSLASALTVGLIGAIATFVFGSLRIAGPAAIFFVLAFTMATGMPLDPALAPLRTGLVLLGGVLSWIIGMMGWFMNPHGPETIAVQQVYKDLAHYMDSIGTDDSNKARQRLVLSLKSAEDTLSAGYISWRSSDQYKRLLILNDQANQIYMNQINRGIQISKPSLKTVFGGSFDKNSIVFLTATRYGIVLTIAAIIAYSFDFNRSYWITLSCASVMSGSTIISTFHRAIQRSIGTILGVLIASIILSLHPEGLVIVIAIVALTALTELAIVVNYAIAALFITSNALLLAESTTQLHNTAFLASARITDVLIGSVIGLIGTLLIGKRQASSLLPHVMAKTLRSEQQFLMMLFSEYRSNTDVQRSADRGKMRTNLTNLNIVYTTALGEIPSNTTALEALRPAIFYIEQLGYLLESSQRYADRPVLSDESLSQLLLVFETMAIAVEQQRPFSTKHIPEIKGFSKIQQDINDLQDALTE